MNILDENKTWLDKNTFNNYLQTNNKLSKQTLINVIKQIKNYFDSNPFISNQKENSKVNQNENDFVESCIEIFLLYLNSYQNFTIINIINEIKNSAPIIYLLEMVKFNKVLSHYNDIDNEQKDTFTSAYYDKNDNTSNEEEQKEPYLKPINPRYKYTLVLDLDETLVHFISDDESDEKSAYIQIRPGAEEFIKDLSEYYEIVIFTAAHKNYADLVIEALDPEGVISQRLYRQHTLSIGNVNIKDLSKLGRDLKHVIIIDNCMENFSIQPKNGLKIVDFEGFEYDDELEYIKEDLIKLAKLNPEDVRYYFKDIQISMDKRAIFLQKIYNQTKNKEELINDNNNTNNLFKEVINNNINNKITDKLTEKIVHKGYSYTEESENVVE
jgi:Dullard-like phosphatase family protein